MTAERRFPVVTVILILANMIAAFGVLFDQGAVNQFGFRATDPTFQAAITCLFIHANWFHLLGNMVFLAAVGATVEIATGSLRFGSVYFISGLAGVLCHWLILRHSPDAAPLVGASGCIAGCAAYYSVRYNSLRVAVAPNRSSTVAIVTVVWLVLQVVGAFVRFGETGGVSFWSHLGGFAAGMVMALVYRAPDLGQARLGHEVLDRMNERSPAAAVAAARQHLQRHPDDTKALRQLARSCAQMEDSAGEAEAILRLLESEPETERAALLGRLIDIGRAGMVPSSRRLVLAERLEGMNLTVAKALLNSVIDDVDDAKRPDALFILAGIERTQQPEKARALLEELARSAPLHPCVELARKRNWYD